MAAVRVAAVVVVFGSANFLLILLLCTRYDRSLGCGHPTAATS